VSLSDELDAPLQTDERLAEIALGEWQGLYREQIRERFPDLFELWYSRPSLVHFPGGEALSDVLTRATEWLQSVLSRDPEGQNVIAVTHTSVIQVLAAAAIGLDLACLHRVHVDNCSVTTLVGSDAPGALVTLNDRRAITATPVAAASTQNLVSWMERRATY
jgi:probable phosphoglycerate mutase